MKKPTLTILVSLLTLLLGFGGGILYQKSKNPGMRFSQTRQGVANNLRTENLGNRNGNRNNAPLSGKIIKVDDTGITVQTSDGGNKMILISDSTKINKASEGSKTDLIEGESVVVSGTQDNTAGSIEASAINIGLTLPF